MTLRIRGEDVAQGIRDWVKGEIETGPSMRISIGRFLFTVSVSTLGVIVSLGKLQGGMSLDSILTLLPIVLFLGAALVALYLSLPRDWLLEGDTDLFDEYRKQIRRISLLTRFWTVLWTVGAISGLYAVLQV